MFWVGARIIQSFLRLTDTISSYAGLAGKFMKVNAGETALEESTNTDTEVADAVTKKHTQAHSVISTTDHTSTATSGKMLQANANGLPVDASNTNTEVADAVTKKHTRNADQRILDSDTDTFVDTEENTDEDKIRMNTGGTERAVLDSLGLTLKTGSNIAFPATATPSADPNTLDDYEEGTWTPSVGGTATYTSRDGMYVKIGSLVYVKTTIIINVLGTGSVTTISGLPFTANASYNFGLPVMYFSNLAVNTIFITGLVEAGTTTVTFRHIAAAGATMTTPNLFGDGARIDFNGWYSI